jgi:hypothetical protein
VTKKDYRAFAEMLHAHLENTKQKVPYAAAEGAIVAIFSIADSMCQIFARDNSRFSSERFLTAVREGLGCKK